MARVSGSIYTTIVCTFAIIRASHQATQTHTKFRSMGYPVEIHIVRTEDNVNLAMERVPSKYKKNAFGDPVLLLHGLFSTSFIFALNATNSLAFVLADAGFDVWLYNARGAGLTRIMTPGNLDEHSWQFSFHEMGYYDVAACVDYIINVTKKAKVNLIGYSMGGTMALILLSERPEYNDKVSKTVLIAPAARLKHSKSPLDIVRFWSPFITEFLDVFKYFPYTMNPDSTLQLIEKYCRGSKRTLNNCRSFIFFINGIPGRIDDEMILSIMGSFPQPMSSRTVKHYVQGIISGEFRNYDYGPAINMIKYDSKVPPSYNLSKITSSTVILCSLTDPVVTMKDTKWLATQLVNLDEVNAIKDVPFGHLSYAADSHAKKLVVDYIVRKLALPYFKGGS